MNGWLTSCDTADLSGHAIRGMDIDHSVDIFAHRFGSCGHGTSTT